MATKPDPNAAPDAGQPPSPDAGQPPSLMQRAGAQAQAANTGPTFTPKDPTPHIPPQLVDTVHRIVAAGMKVIYSPAMAKARQDALSSPEPMPKKLADNVTGLMLVLDQKSQPGLPPEALFPSAVLLLNEIAGIFVQAGQNVTEDDYTAAIQILYVQLGKKLGATNDQLMQGAEQALQKGGGVTGNVGDAGATGTADDGDAGGAAAAAGAPGPAATTAAGPMPPVATGGMPMPMPRLAP